MGRWGAHLTPFPVPFSARFWIRARFQASPGVILSAPSSVTITERAALGRVSDGLKMQIAIPHPPVRAHQQGIVSFLQPVSLDLAKKIGHIRNTKRGLYE